MGERDWAASGNLLAEQGHRAKRSKNIAKAHHREATQGPLALGLLSEPLDHQLGQALAGRHHVGGAHGFVCGEQHHLAQTLV